MILVLIILMVIFGYAMGLVVMNWMYGFRGKKLINGVFSMLFILPVLTIQLIGPICNNIRKNAEIPEEQKRFLPIRVTTAMIVLTPILLNDALCEIVKYATIPLRRKRRSLSEVKETLLQNATEAVADKMYAYT